DCFRLVAGPAELLENFSRPSGGHLSLAGERQDQKQQTKPAERPAGNEKEDCGAAPQTFFERGATGQGGYQWPHGFTSPVGQGTTSSATLTSCGAPPRWLFRRAEPSRCNRRRLGGIRRRSTPS